MKCRSLAVVLLCVMFILSGPAQAQVSFFQPVTFPDCSGPLFVADFNQDSKPDLLCANGVLDLGNGDGTFKAGTPFPGSALAVADFNGDGKPDLLEEGTNSFSVWETVTEPSSHRSVLQPVELGKRPFRHSWRRQC